MSWDALFVGFGYLLTFIGTFVEGEITLMTSSYMAFLGNLSILVVFLIGIAGVMCADNWWFYVGKRFGTKFVDSHAHLKVRVSIVQQLLEKNQLLVVLLYRYAWGFRTITPIVLGTTHISRLRFFIYTLIITPIWATIFASIGYRFGAQLTAVIAYVRSVQIMIFFVVVCAIAWYVYRRYEQQLRVHVKRSVVASRQLHKRIQQNVRKMRVHTQNTGKQLSRLGNIGNRRLFKEKRKDK